MRTNLPVTNVEYRLKDNEFIVSKTDLKGRITYINRPFVEISGFSSEELLGASHNIVRHPDMPPAAFKDLWATLRSGNSWRGMVKNRCKNGDHYWVDASANPITDNGQIIGYMSLRIKPTAAQIEEADRTYRLLREGKARGLTVKAGRIVRTGILSRLAALVGTTISARLSAAFTFLVAAMIALGGIGLWTTRDSSARAFLQPLLGALLASSVALTVWAWWFVRNKVIAPLQSTVRICEGIAAGDLTLRNVVQRQDEIGMLMHALNTMTGNLASIVADIRVSSGATSRASEQVSATWRPRKHECLLRC